MSAKTRVEQFVEALRRRVGYRATTVPRETTLAHARDGELVKVSGTLVRGEAVASPLGDSVLVFLLEVEDTDSGAAVPLFRDAGSGTFELDDGTSTVTVRPSDPLVLARPGARYRDYSAEPRLAGYLDRKRRHGEAWRGGLRYRHSKGRVGDRVQVAGILQRGAGAYRDRGSELVAPPHGRLWIRLE